jgi:hypothetical protein
VESENQCAVGLGFDDLAGVPLLLGDQAGVGSGEPEHDVEVSIAPSRAEAFHHKIPGTEAGRATERLSGLLDRAHPLDLEQPDIVPQMAMANQAPVVVGGKDQVVGVDGPPLRFVPTSGPVDHAQLPRVRHCPYQNPKVRNAECGMGKERGRMADAATKRAARVPAGRHGATGAERLRPRANGLRSGGGERGGTDGFARRNCLVR